MSLNFSRNGEHRFTLPLQNYCQNPSDKETVLFTPFTLKPGDEWSHIVNFLNLFSRQDQHQYRRMHSALQSHIFQQLPPKGQETQLVEANPEFVQPIVQFFEARLIGLTASIK